MKTIREYIDLIENLSKQTKKPKKPKDIEEDQATAKMGLMSAMGSNSGGEDRQRMAQQAVERIADNK